MTKKEIVKTISDEIGLTQLKTKEIVQKTFDAIVETLVEERVRELERQAAAAAERARAGLGGERPPSGDSGPLTEPLGSQGYNTPSGSG